jgi:hypothetical protein
MIKKIIYILIFLMLMVLSTYVFIGPKQQISENEKRNLATWPDFTLEKYFNGGYFDAISLYVNDHFPLRIKMIDWANQIRYGLGIHPESEERIIIVPSNTESQTALINDTLTKEYNDDFKAAYSGEMLIINGRVYPQGSGSPAMGKPFAAMINEYARKLEGICKVYSLVAPLSSAFINVKKYSYYNQRNKETLNAIRSALSTPSIFCDVFGEMDKHFGEEMFYGSDHHWNARGAYYGYVSYCSAAGIIPLSLSSMQYKKRKPFLGSLYDLTQDPEVALHPDTAEFYIPPTETKAYRYSANSLNNPTLTKVFCEASNYNAFLCGDAPLIKITTNVQNGRKAAVIKNSMGNAFSVYLVSHYEEIWVIDFRYSGHNLMELIAANHINDLIFAVGMYAAMSHGTINMMRNLAKDHSPALSAKRDSLKAVADSTGISNQLPSPSTDTLH